MKLLWKLLRTNISVSQFCGFIFANLFGLFIVLAGFQFYNDVLPIFTSEDTFMKANYIMVTKRISTGSTVSGKRNVFSQHDIDELRNQPFVHKVGVFSSTNYKTDAQMGINGKQILNTEMFIESVPDEFVDTDKKEWKYEPGSKEVPVILPRTYINMYNFGYARNHSLPQISDGLIGTIDFNIHIKGNGKEEDIKGRVIALSNSLSAVLVPQSFMDWSNKEYAPNETDSPNRLLMEVSDPADKQIEQYFDEQGLDMESDKLNTEKTVHFLRLIISLVMIVGLIISILSFYILILSIYLLVQKNTDKLQNLLLIGYTASKTALPYQLLSIALNFAVLIISIAAVIIVRHCYMDIMQGFYPLQATVTSSILCTIALGFAIFLFVSLLNTVIIRNKIKNINH